MSGPEKLLRRLVGFLKAGKGSEFSPEESKGEARRHLEAMIEQVKEGSVKVGFELEPTDWHQASRERLWGEVIWGRRPFQAVLVNIPFHAVGVSYGDTVLLRPSEEEPPPFYLFSGVEARGGHSTFHVLTPAAKDGLRERWPRLEALGCRCESGEQDGDDGPVKFYAIDAPPGSDIGEITSILTQGARDGLWWFRVGDIERGGAAAPPEK